MLDRNTWKYSIACKLFAFYMNSWYLLVGKQIIRDKKKYNYLNAMEHWK